MAENSLNWAAIDNDPRFRRLHRKKSAFLARLMAVAAIYYFLLPLGAAWFGDLFRARLFGVVNFGILFALSQFLVAWGIAGYYAVKAKEFDAMAQELVEDARRIGER